MERRDRGPAADARMDARKRVPRDVRIVQRLVRWFRASARDLPWRSPPPAAGARDPYLALVSEAMLQQTQVSRVVDRFGAFLERFPDLASLARAGEDEVLASWSGLGYYRRARLLHRASQAIRDLHGGQVPSDPRALRGIPGVGRYTAGAIASICFGRPEPIVDGNVRRVLARLDARRRPSPNEGNQRGEPWNWKRAKSLVALAARQPAPCPGPLNEALMELGATVCTPQRPRCGSCPLRALCRAHSLGVVDRIPAPRRPPPRSLLHHDPVLIVDDEGRVLLEQRPGDGLWPRLWQPPALEGPAPASAASLRRSVGLRAPPEPIARFDHLLSHRRVRFTVWFTKVLGPVQAIQAAARRPGSRWLSLADASALALSGPHRRILGLVGPGAGIVTTDAPCGRHPGVQRAGHAPGTAAKARRDAPAPGRRGSANRAPLDHR